MDRRILAVTIILCAVVLCGELSVALHQPSGYGSSFSLDEDGFTYSFGPGTSGEYNILVTDNGGSVSVEKVYIYSDTSYGFDYSFYRVDLYADYLKNRLHDRGFTDCEIVDAKRLISLMDESPVGKGLVISAGAIPEEIASGKLLSWVQAGGMLYWTWGVIGERISYSDGTCRDAGTSLQSQFLGSECTDRSDSKSGYLSKDPISMGLKLENNWMNCAVDSTKVVGDHMTFGYQDGNRNEVTIISCGSGNVCIMSGATDTLQVNDLAQVICAGLTSSSTVVFQGNEAVPVRKTVEKDESVVLQSGHHYAAYIYVSGINAPYGKTFREVAP